MGRRLSFVQFYPTFRCNQDCSFCFNGDRGEAEDALFDDCIRLLDVLDSNDIHEIDIMGGEPFLVPWMPEFLGTALTRGLSVYVSTNGSRPRALSGLKAADPRRLHIGVSLEGGSEGTHASRTSARNFSDALETIGEILRLGLSPIVKTVVTESSIPDIQNIIDLVRPLGVERFYLIHMDLLSREAALQKDTLSYPSFMKVFLEARRTNPEMQIFKVNASCFDRRSLPEGLRCPAGVTKLAVAPDGSVYPCNLFLAIGRFRLGNILTDDFAELMAHPLLSSVTTDSGNRCTIRCAERDQCTGGCPAHGFYHFGSLDAPDIRCTL